MGCHRQCRRRALRSHRGPSRQQRSRRLWRRTSPPHARRYRKHDPSARWTVARPRSDSDISRASFCHGAVYRRPARFAGLGYEIRVAGHDGRWELADYTREQVMAFSRRRQEENGRSRVKGWRAPRRRRTSRIERDSPRIIATKKVSRRNGARARRNMELRLSVISRILAIAATSNFDIRKRRSKLSAIVSTKISSAPSGHRSFVRLSREPCSTEWQADLHSYALRVSDQQSGRLIAAGEAVNSPRGAYTTPDDDREERDNID